MNLREIKRGLSLAGILPSPHIKIQSRRIEVSVPSLQDPDRVDPYQTNLLGERVWQHLDVDWEMSLEMRGRWVLRKKRSRKHETANGN